MRSRSIRVSGSQGRRPEGIDAHDGRRGGLDLQKRGIAGVGGRVLPELCGVSGGWYAVSMLAGGCGLGAGKAPGDAKPGHQGRGELEARS